MPYEFTGRDLDNPRDARSHDQPTDAVADAFEWWMDEARETPRREIGGSVSDRHYQRAQDALAELERIDAREATSLLVAYRDEAPPTSGLFLSAAYERADADIVFFDASTPVPVKWLGYRLDAEMALVVDAPVASVMAAECEGLVVNRSTIDSYFGYSSDGAFVTHSDAECATMGLGTARASLNFGTVGRSDRERPVVALGGGPHAGFEADAETAREIDALAAVLDQWRDGLAGDDASVRAFLESRPTSPRDALVAALDDALGVVES